MREKAANPLRDCGVCDVKAGTVTPVFSFSFARASRKPQRKALKVHPISGMESWNESRKQENCEEGCQEDCEESR
jgi:hypothetical protein